MLKNLLITTAVSGLMIGMAAAQGTPPSPAAPAPPAASAPAPDAGKSTAMPSGEVKFINSQRADQWLGSKFRGTDVVGADNQQIGDVSDILFDKDGKVEAFIVSIGGFLGIGAKDVAVAPSAFQVVAGDKSKSEADKLKIGLNKEQLQQAATFEPYRPPATTTGMAPPRTGAPRPAAQ